MTKTEILNKLWEELDANIAKAIPIQKELFAAKKAADMEDWESRCEVAELEVKKYQESGQAPGLAAALSILCPSDFPTYKEVIRHAQARYSAKQKGEEIETPGFPAAPGAKASPNSTATAASADVPQDAEPEPPAQEKPKSTAPRRGRASSGRPKLDPGPDRAKPEQTETEDLPAPVAAALEKARAKMASRRPDDTPEEQAANHKADLPDAGEDIPFDEDEMRKQLAEIEDF